jgi:hypothetical protein
LTGVGKFDIPAPSGIAVARLAGGIDNRGRSAAAR